MRVGSEPGAHGRAGVRAFLAGLGWQVPGVCQPVDHARAAYRHVDAVYGSSPARAAAHPRRPMDATAR